MVTKRDYNSLEIEAAKSVLIELMHLLGEYREDIVIVGGWVPEFILNKKKEPYVGTIDVDVALDHRKLQDEGYRSIQELLLNRGYTLGKQPFIFKRELEIDNQKIIIQVDLLAGEYEGTGTSHRHQKFQGIHARKVRGCEIAFQNPIRLTVDGVLPSGGKDSVTIKIASIVSFLVMKGMALDDRIKEKDAWDIYYCLTNYEGGLDGLIKEFKPYMDDGLVKEGLSKIAKHFASIDHTGPKHVADFDEITDEEERARIQRDAFERVNYLLENLGIILK